MAPPILERVRLPPGLQADLQRVLVQLQNNVEAALRRLGGVGSLMEGVMVEGITLGPAATFVQHGLGREAKGYLVTSQDMAGSVYRAAAANPRPDSHIALATDAPGMTINLWVY